MVCPQYHALWCRYCVIPHSLLWILCTAMVWHAFSCPVSEIFFLEYQKSALSWLWFGICACCSAPESHWPGNCRVSANTLCTGNHHLPANIHHGLLLTKIQWYLYYYEWWWCLLDISFTSIFAWKNVALYI